MSNSIAPGSSVDVNVKVTALTTNPNVPVTYKTIILKKNLVNGVNTITQEMMSATNIKYIIKYDYVLGEDITIPDNCILEFDGGSLSNGTINGSFTVICNIKDLIFKNIILSNEVYGNINSYNIINENNVFQELLNLFKFNNVTLYKDYTVIIPNKNNLVNKLLTVEGNKHIINIEKDINITGYTSEICHFGLGNDTLGVGTDGSILTLNNVNINYNNDNNVNISQFYWGATKRLFGARNWIINNCNFTSVSYGLRFFEGGHVGNNTFMKLTNCSFLYACFIFEAIPHKIFIDSCKFMYNTACPNTETGYDCMSSGHSGKLDIYIKDSIIGGGIELGGEEGEEQNLIITNSIIDSNVSFVCRVTTGAFNQITNVKIVDSVLKPLYNDGEITKSVFGGHKCNNLEYINCKFILGKAYTSLDINSSGINTEARNLSLVNCYIEYQEDFNTNRVDFIGLYFVNSTYNPTIVMSNVTVKGKRTGWGTTILTTNYKEETIKSFVDRCTFDVNVIGSVSSIFLRTSSSVIFDKYAYIATHNGIRHGVTSRRPESITIGTSYYDTDLGKLIYANAIETDGTVIWKDATGATV